MSQKQEKRAWRLLSEFILERRRLEEVEREGNRDIEEEDKEARTFELSEAGRRLLMNKDFQKLRMDGMHRLMLDFVRWLELDPSGPKYVQELTGLHYRSSATYIELFRVEEIRTEAKHYKTPQEGGGPDARSAGRSNKRRH